MKAFWSFVGSILVILAVAWYLMNHVFITDEQRILRLIENVRVSVESGSVFSLNNALAADYQHGSGAGRSMVLRGLQQFFNDTDNRRIQLGNTEIQINGGAASAVVRFSFQAEFRSPSSPFQEYAEHEGMHQIQVEFIKNDYGWEVFRTNTPNQAR